MTLVLFGASCEAEERGWVKTKCIVEEVSCGPPPLKRAWDYRRGGESPSTRITPGVPLNSSCVRVKPTGVSVKQLGGNVH